VANARSVIAGEEDAVGGVGDDMGRFPEPRGRFRARARGSYQLGQPMKVPTTSSRPPIAACHAHSYDETDWASIATLYGLLAVRAASPQLLPNVRGAGRV
jgi:hypothetical protein